MKQDIENSEWPRKAGDPQRLPVEQTPSHELEERIAKTLCDRGLIRSGEAVRHQSRRRTMQSALAIAASVALVAVGIGIGRSTATGQTDLPGSPLTGAETDLYALLLYETEGYDAPNRMEATRRYGEYSKWVADARGRGQFVTGEDLEVAGGWVLKPTPTGVEVIEEHSIGADAPLSGLFFIRARDVGHALELARELPHLRHGGQVVVQKTIPTDQPPPAGGI